jgi:hypothetical protein
MARKRKPQTKPPGFAVGELNGNARLSWSAVAQIRRSSETCVALGKRFNVCWSTVWMARHERTWPDPQHHNLEGVI